MILVMKMLSVGFDLDNGLVQHDFDIWLLFAYSFQPATVIYGPWISLQQFNESLKKHSFMVILHSPPTCNSSDRIATDTVGCMASVNGRLFPVVQLLHRRYPRRHSVPE
jgi:hypothetical protein